MNALTLLTIAATAAFASAHLGYSQAYSAHPNTYHGLVPHGYGYTGVYPASVPVSHAPLTYSHAAPVTYSTAPYAPVQSQYHAQDELGQYTFGYAGGPSARSETRDAFGVVRGSYNYIDSEGKVQTQHYVADALGFRVSGTNLPVGPDAPVAAPLAVPAVLPEPVQDTPEVAAAKAAHEAAYNEAAAAAAAAAPERKKRSVLAAHALGVYSPRRFSYGFSAPLSYGYPTVYGAHHALTPYTHATNTYRIPYAMPMLMPLPRMCMCRLLLPILYQEQPLQVAQHSSE
ncbi:cuticle protein 19.8-like [Macrobrachium nipponense]|uniref:cuticle protein 19.8-like n=1 Tax=Macrobrachium nipponense TaxID=159736 RepID=UPI0030C7E31D